MHVVSGLYSIERCLASVCDLALPCCTTVTLTIYESSLHVCFQQMQVGLVGYPNVGKSSTINALFGAKKTAVAPTPGKTKHFQTLIVSPTLCLCDCPGKAGVEVRVISQKSPPFLVCFAHASRRRSDNTFAVALSRTMHTHSSP
jgi:hypothetical protein